MIWILFTTTIALAIWSLHGRTADRVAALLIAIALTLAAGLRSTGYDYDNYVNMIFNLQNHSNIDFKLRLHYGKDPMMILIIDLLSPYIGTATWPVFLAFSFIAVVTKFIAAMSLPRFSAIFLAIYLIFLSPTLEFSGIRSAAAIGLLLMCAAYSLRLLILLPLLAASVATHISLVIPALSRFVPRLFRRRITFVAISVIIAIVAFLESGIIDTLWRGQSYIGKSGTRNALLFPSMSLILFYTQLWVTDPAKNGLNLIICVSMGLAMGLALPSVGVSHRLLEIGLCLFLFAICKDWATGNHIRGKFMPSMVMAGFLILLTIRHLWEGNWLVMHIL